MSARTGLALALLGSMVAGLSGAPADRSTVALFVSAERGIDTNPGTTPEAPLRTLVQARNALRRLRRTSTNADAAPAAQATVHVAGVHRLARTFELGAEDSGVRYVAWKGESPAVVSGALEISQWRVDTPNGHLEATVPRNATFFSQLWVNGERQVRARSPNVQDTADRGMGDASTFKWAEPLQPCNGSTCPEGNRLGFVYQGSDLQPSDANGTIVFFQSWNAWRSHIALVNPANHTVLFDKPARAPVGQYTHQGGKRYFLEGVAAALDAPGEWFLDYPARVVRYVQPGGLAGANLVAMAPQLDVLMRIDGANDIAVEGISFVYGAYTTDTITGAVTIANSRNTQLLHCEVSHVGLHGICTQAGIDGLTIDHCHIGDTGGNGIQMTVPDARNVLISNTVVNDTGFLNMNQPASVYLKGNASIVARNNEVSFSPYAGFRVGWQTGGPSPRPLTPIFTVSWNLIHDYGLRILSDFGGLYVSSSDNVCFEKGTCSLPSNFHQNIVHRARHYNYGSQGVYMDEQVAGVNITSNLFYDIGESGLYFHCGTDNRAENNIVAYATQEGPYGYIRSCNSGGNPTYPNISRGFDFLRNILYVADKTGGEQLTVDNDYLNTEFDFNVYWTPNASLALQFPNKTTFQEWRAEHQDAHSVIADPLFVDPASLNFALQPGSPALNLGFKPIDTAHVGPDGTSRARRGRGRGSKAG